MSTAQVATPPPSEATHAPDAYAVKERVAIGTAGVVYRAVHQESGREVLFKVLMEQASHPLNAAQVLVISPALMRLKHPNIAELQDAYNDPEGTVLVYPLVQGVAGSEFPQKAHHLSPAEGRLIARQVCEALLAGERAGFPHGDLKPSNILISENKESGRLSAQVQDWGLSSCRTVQPPETLQFMAPERHLGHPTSMQGDLFSLGASLWFLITGHLPVESHTREELLKEWGAFDTNTMAGLQPEMDTHFLQWLGWLLRWQPRDRPASVTKALEVLHQVIAFVDAADSRAHSSNASSVAAAAASQPSPPSTPATPLPGKPLATRPSVARTERLKRSPSDAGPPSHGAPPSASAPASPPSPSPAPLREKPPVARKLMAAVLVCCAIGAAGVLFVWWAEEEWGPEWRKEMMVSLRNRWRTTAKSEPALASTAAPESSSTPATKPSGNSTKAASKPSGATGVTANASAQKPAPKSLSSKPGPAPAKPPSPPAASNKPISAVELFQYVDGMTLEGAGGGTGWKSAWKATQASKGKSPDGKYQGVILAAAAPATMSRELDPGSTFSNGSVAVSLDLWHPGAGAAPLELDLLGTAGTPSGSPVIITPEGNRVKISIKDQTEVLHATAGTPLKLVLKCSFKRKPDGMADVEVVVYLNPKPGASNPVALSPSIKKSVTSYKLPSSLTFLARTTEAGTAPVMVQKMRLAKTAGEAVK
ncbi:MAG TPA: serine/threonine-protein kinase [Candidatus Saccharimonadia bacterium]|nr:serine/threonine-protein kinase [Candidatus Saccharimonadia bacterium]